MPNFFVTLSKEGAIFTEGSTGTRTDTPIGTTS
jgi:hypothetical protein